MGHGPDVESADSIRSARRLAKLAQGSVGAVSVSPGAWRPSTQHIGDCEFVNEDSAEIIQDAQRGLVWAHRLVRPHSPFADITLRFDRMLDAADAKQAILEEKRRKANENRDRKRRMRRKVKPRQTKAQKLVEVKRLKKRTREQRIADLQKALRKEGG